MKIEFKGMVRGTFSEFQAVGYIENPVMTFVGRSVMAVLEELILDEWIGYLVINGRKVKNVMEYCKNRGLKINYTRCK